MTLGQKTHEYSLSINEEKCFNPKNKHQMEIEAAAIDFKVHANAHFEKKK
jgi:hypothetical protein